MSNEPGEQRKALQVQNQNNVRQHDQQQVRQDQLAETSFGKRVAIIA